MSINFQTDVVSDMPDISKIGMNIIRRARGLFWPSHDLDIKGHTSFPWSLRQSLLLADGLLNLRERMSSCQLQFFGVIHLCLTTKFHPTRGENATTRSNQGTLREHAELCVEAGLIKGVKILKSWMDPGMARHSIEQDFRRQFPSC